MILEILIIAGGVKAYDKARKWANESDAAEPLKRAAHVARQMKTASATRTRQIVDAARQRAQEGREPGVPWRMPKFGKDGTENAGWSHVKPHEYIPHIVDPKHPMAPAWRAYAKWQMGGRTAELWSDFQRALAACRRDPRAKRSWFAGPWSGTDSAWDTPDDLYGQYAKARGAGKPAMTVENVADKLAIPLDEARRVLDEWETRYRADKSLADLENGGRLVSVNRRSFGSKDEAQDWAEKYRCEDCGTGGDLLTPDEGTAQLLITHRPGCGNPEVTGQPRQASPESGTASPTTGDEHPDVTSANERADHLYDHLDPEQEQYDRLNKCVALVDPRDLCGEPQEEGSLFCPKHNGQQRATDAPAASEGKTDGGNMSDTTPKYDVNAPRSTGAAGATGGPQAEDLFELVKSYIEAPVGRGLGEILERLAVIAHGITTLSAAGAAFKTLLDEYKVDPAIVDGVQAGFADVGRGATTLIENAELGKGFYEQLVQALKNTGGRIPDHELLNQDRQHA